MSTDHRPLFPPGMHHLQESELDNHFLSQFEASKTRPMLIAGLRAFLASLRRAGVTFEVWLDGSFCTEKVDPSDVDLVVFADPNDLNRLEPVAKQRLRALLDRTSSKAIFGCDVLFAPTTDEDLRSYWRGWYGFDRSERPKGIAQLVVTP